MSAVKQLSGISIDDYLAGELYSPVKHEYIAGTVYAMAGARNVHNQIASNVLIGLGSRLRGRDCRAFNSDTKVRLETRGHPRFYYPDAMVVCRQNPDSDTFQDEPVILVEVLSPRTRRIDEVEKVDAYLTIPSLSVYILIEQDTPVINLYRRTETGFVEEFYQRTAATIPLPEVNAELPMSEIYDGVAFSSDRPE